MKGAGYNPLGRAAGRILAVAAVSSLAIIVFASFLIYSAFFSSVGSSFQPEAPIASAAADRSMTIAIARTAGGPSEWRTYARAVKRMSDATGRPMRVRYVESRSEIVRIMKSGEVDAGFLCTYCYLELAGSKGISLIAAPRIAGETKDAAVLVVRGSTRYRSLKDLEGHRVGVMGPTSLAGYKYLYWLANREHVDTARSLTIVPGETQDQNLRALLAGAVDAVVVNRSQLAMWGQTDLKIITQSPEYGMPPFVTGSTVDTATRDTMKRALLGLRPSGGQARTAIEGFSEVTARDYDFARQLLRVTSIAVGPR